MPALQGKEVVHGTIKKNTKKNPPMGNLINVMPCCNKEHLKMDEV